MLLIDEVDRADEAFEAFLLEVLAEWQVTIPELGSIRARHVPHVVLTSNRTRELSDALRRRCLFIWLPYPTLAEEIAILHARVPGLAERLANRDRAGDAGPSGLAVAEGAWRGREPGLGAGPCQPAPGSPRSRRAGADARSVLKVREDHAVLSAHRDAIAPILTGASALEPGGRSLSTDFGLGSVSSPDR